MAGELTELLIRIQQDVGSFRRMAEAAGLAPDVFARVARGASGMSAESAMRLAAYYGRAYGFTEDQALQWTGHRSSPPPMAQAGQEGQDGTRAPAARFFTLVQPRGALAATAWMVSPARASRFLRRDAAPARKAATASARRATRGRAQAARRVAFSVPRAMPMRAAAAAGELRRTGWPEAALT